jgi:hypothetical protein
MKDIKKHLLNILYTGHHHAEMKDWVMCSTCTPHIAKWQAERDRMKALHPQHFINQETKTEEQRLKEANAMFDDMRRESKGKIRVEIK